MCQEDRQEVESLERKEDYKSTDTTIQLHISKEKGKLQESQRYKLKQKMKFHGNILQFPFRVFS